MVQYGSFGNLHAQLPSLPGHSSGHPQRLHWPQRCHLRTSLHIGLGQRSSCTSAFPRARPDSSLPRVHALHPASAGSWKRPRPRWTQQFPFYNSRVPCTCGLPSCNHIYWRFHEAESLRTDYIHCCSGDFSHRPTCSSSQSIVYWVLWKWPRGRDYCRRTRAVSERVWQL